MGVTSHSMKLQFGVFALLGLLLAGGCYSLPDAGAPGIPSSATSPTLAATPAATSVMPARQAATTPAAKGSTTQPTPEPSGGPTYFDAFDYCSAVGESPASIRDDPRYQGDLSPWVVVPPEWGRVPPGYSWRCAKGLVETCIKDSVSACTTSDSWKVISAPSGPSYRDPFTYCRVRGTVDHPQVDREYRGDPFPPTISAVIFSGSEIRGGWTWRCLDGRVLGCNIGTALLCFQPDATNKIPSPVLIDYCATSTSSSLPTAVMPKFTIYIWECRDKKPVITGEWALDSRGFIRDVWKVIPSVP